MKFNDLIKSRFTDILQLVPKKRIWCKKIWYCIREDWQCNQRCL